MHPKAETDQLLDADPDEMALLENEPRADPSAGSAQAPLQREVAQSHNQAAASAPQPQPVAEASPVVQPAPVAAPASRDLEATTVEAQPKPASDPNAVAVAASSSGTAGAPAPDGPGGEDEIVVTPEVGEDGCTYWEITLKKEHVDDKFGFVQANGKLEFETRLQSSSGSAASAAQTPNSAAAAEANADHALPPGPQVLIVRRIHENSLLHRWNRRHPEARVFPLDRICSVNGENTVESMQREIRSQSIVLRFMRYPERFAVTLKKDGRRLGFRFEFPQGAKAEEVRVTQLMTEGALPFHNAEQVSRARWHYVVLPDMRIEAANDVYGNASQIAEELKSCEEVTLRLRRAEHALLNSRHLQVRAQAIAGFMGGGGGGGGSSGESNPNSPTHVNNATFAASTPSPTAGGS